MNRHSRMTIIALAAVFLAPLVLAWGLYHRTIWRPAGILQHGELLLPVRPLALPPMGSANGFRQERELFRRHWTLLYRSKSRCDPECRAMMDTLGRVRLAQGRAIGRVQRVLVETVPPGEGGADVVSTDGDVRVMRADRWPLPAGSVYIVDPEGNLVLRYRPGFEPSGLLKDLQRLLKLSGEG